MPIPAAIVVGAMVAGTAVQMYGQYKQSRNQAEAEERQAAIRRMQSQEMLARQVLNEQVLRDAEIQEEGKAVALAGESGTGNLGLGSIMRLRHNLSRTIEFSRREASFKAKMLELGADVDTKLASDMRSAGDIGMAGTLLTGVAKVGNYAYDASPGDSKPLPGAKKQGV